MKTRDQAHFPHENCVVVQYLLPHQFADPAAISKMKGKTIPERNYNSYRPVPGFAAP
jgi:hypothetical protein